MGQRAGGRAAHLEALHAVTFFFESREAMVGGLRVGGILRFTDYPFAHTLVGALSVEACCQVVNGAAGQRAHW